MSWFECAISWSTGARRLWAQISQIKILWCKSTRLSAKVSWNGVARTPWLSHQFSTWVDQLHPHFRILTILFSGIAACICWTQQPPSCRVLQEHRHAIPEEKIQVFVIHFNTVQFITSIKIFHWTATHFAQIQTNYSNNISIASRHEFREEIRRLGFLWLEPPAHDVALLFPDLNGFLQLHLSLDDQHINHPNVLDFFVREEHFLQLVAALRFWLRDVVLVN